jgi:2-haloacid dehalogenase
MVVNLAFDVYGTLIDTHGVVSKLKDFLGEKAENFSHTWRDKQLEYSFRRGLMQHYVPFSTCTAHALDFACLYYETPLTAQQKQILLKLYSSPPAFPDAKEGLKLLQSESYRCFAFSNGAKADVESVLEHAQILKYFQGVISVEDIKSFKPNPGVYSHFLRQSGSSHQEAWLVSSNSFDVLGALSSGMKAVWLKRYPKAILDPWDIKPTLTITDLCDLPKSIS